MNYISVKHLTAIKACEDQVSKFEDIFGKSVSFSSLNEAKELAKKYAQDFDFNFIGVEVFGKAYEEAKEPLWEDYLEAKEPLLKAYKEAEAQIFAEITGN